MKRLYYSGNRPWRKMSLLDRLPNPKAQEKVRLNEGNIVHSDIHLDTKPRGEEHIFPLDLDYMHVVAKDQEVGLVLTGLHPNTRIKDVKDFLRKKVAIRHCWIHSKGVACIRFQDEHGKEEAKSLFENQGIYPFHIYDPSRRNWLGTAPPDQDPIKALPLTTQYDHKEPEPSRVLVMRSVLGLPDATMAIFRRYGSPEQPVRSCWTKFYAHDRWIWEYFLQFPNVEAASQALELHHGQKVTIPYRNLPTSDKLRFPYGKTLHLWLRHTGLRRLPSSGTQGTWLFK
ncbi:hypothetical protein CPB86DRAFT_772171 [Serendipita vermifera]|nr:hypothetical protein CPB86DRAFT_772171 [Serendipita vermifera]